MLMNGIFKNHVTQEFRADIKNVNIKIKKLKNKKGHHAEFSIYFDNNEIRTIILKNSNDLILYNLNFTISSFNFQNFHLNLKSNKLLT